MHDVRSGELGFDVSERILPDIIDPELSACQRWERHAYSWYPPPLPKNTLNGESKTAISLPHPPLDSPRRLRSGGVQRSSRSCERKKAVLSTCKNLSRTSHRRLELVYVFQAPDVSITALWSSVEAASVWYFLCRA